MKMPSLHLIPSLATPPSRDLPLNLSRSPKKGSLSVWSDPRMLLYAVCTSISTHDTGEAYKGCMLNEPCKQWVRDGHVLAQESVQRQMHCPDLAFEVANGHLGGSRRLWVMRYRALGRCRLKLLHTKALQRVTDEQ